MSEGNSAVSFKNAYIYQSDNNLVLSSLNFDIAKGEFVYLIGRTGSGKSSLLKTLYADLWLEKGNATIAGFDLHNLKRKDIPFLRRKLGVVFQDFQLFTDRNVKDNLQFVLDATGWKSKSLIQMRIDEVLTQVGLENSLNKFPHQLSGGEQQRLVIARSLLNNPVILLADEPTGNLDPEVSEQIMATFEAINASGTAVLMATHDFELIRKYPRRTLRCENGEVHENAQTGNTLKPIFNTVKTTIQPNEIEKIEAELVHEIKVNDEKIVSKEIDNVEETVVSDFEAIVVSDFVPTKIENVEVLVGNTEIEEILQINNSPVVVEIEEVESSIEIENPLPAIVEDETELALTITETPESIEINSEEEITFEDQLVEVEIVAETKVDIVKTTMPQNDENIPLENLISIKPVKAKLKKENAKMNTSFFDTI